MEELKLKKQKRETKKELKKEEDKLKKNPKNTLNVKEKAKKSKKVVESKEKEKKTKLRVLIYKVLDWITTIIEQFILWLVALIGWVGILIILFVIVLMIIIYGLLHMEYIISDGEFFQGEDVCIQGPQVMTSQSFDMSQVSSLMGTFTGGDKQAAEILSMYSDVLNRDMSTVVVNDGYVTALKEKMGIDKVIYFYYGFGSVENSGGLRNIPTNGDSLFQYPSTQTGSAYVFLGLHNCNVFDGTWKYTSDVEGTKVLKDEFVSEIKSKYIPAETPIHEDNFMPYGVSTHIGVISCQSLSNKYESVEKELDAIMDKYGIQSNREVLKGFVELFASASAYHSGGSKSMSDSNREGLFSLWCALWSATSEDDNKRSFDNIKVVNPNYSYNEPQMRPYFFGDKNFYMTWDVEKSGFFEIDGKSVNQPLWAWVRDNCTNKEYFSTTAEQWLNNLQGPVNGGSDSPVTDSSYGIAAYIIGRDLASSLGTTAPLASGGDYNDCDCVDNTPTTSFGTVGNIDLNTVQAGEVQGPWSEDVKAILENETNLKKYYGTADAISNPDTKFETYDMTFEEWRQSTRWGVPYYVQSDYNTESSYNASTESVEIPSSWTSSLGQGGTLGWAGCHIYMYSYMASCLTSTVINPTEMTVALHHLEGISSSGINQAYNAVNVFHKLGLKAVSVHNGLNGDTSEFSDFFGIDNSALNSTDSATLQGIFDTVLEKNGLIGIAGGTDTFTKNTNHYVVIHEKKGDGYRAMGYHMDGNAYEKDSDDICSWDFIYKAMSYHPKDSNYNFQTFYAWNPTLQIVMPISSNNTSSSVSSTSVGSSDGNVIPIQGPVNDNTDIIRANRRTLGYKSDNPDVSTLKQVITREYSISSGMSYINKLANSNVDQKQIAQAVQGKMAGNTLSALDGEVLCVGNALLVATTNKFGSMGDYLYAHFEDGSGVLCIRVEGKSESRWYGYADPANEWGHWANSYAESADTISLLEACGATNDAVSQKKIDWIMNLGTYYDNPDLANKSEEEIAKVVGNPSLLSTSSVDCVNQVPTGVFAETPGQFQGAWGDLTDAISQISNAGLREKCQNLIQFVGIKPIWEGNEEILGYTYDVDKWKAQNGYGTVRYCQMSSHAESFGAYSFGDSTFNSAGCGVFSTACVLSTLSGKYITPPEVALAVNTYTIRHPGTHMALSNANGDSSGAFTHTDLAKVIEEFGYKTECMDSLNLDKVDTCLNNNGMVILVVNSSFNHRFTGAAHYVVIREKVDDGYLIYSSTNWKNYRADYCNKPTTALELKVLSEGQIILVTP